MNNWPTKLKNTPNELEREIRLSDRLEKDLEASLRKEIGLGLTPYMKGDLGRIDLRGISGKKGGGKKKKLVAEEDSLAKLKPALNKEGSTPARNESQIPKSAAAMLLTRNNVKKDGPGRALPKPKAARRHS